VKRIRRTIVPLAALVAAVVLALVGQSVFAVAGDLRSPDVKREPARDLPSRVANDLVSAGDNLSFRQALRLLKQKGGPQAQKLERRADAEAKLDRLTKRGSRPRRAQAENLLTILRLHDALLSRGDPTSAIAAAIRSFGQAVRLDPRNSDAKYNLELLLTLRPQNRGAKQSKTTKPVSKHGSPASGRAGTVHTGTGY
jgi:hypothetical protein